MRWIAASRLSRMAIAAATAGLSCDAALAAQGPGTGAGTASSATQFVLAIIVYGTAALVVAAGLIGAVRQATLPAPNQNIENNPMDSSRPPA